MSTVESSEALGLRYFFATNLHSFPSYCKKEEIYEKGEIHRSCMFANNRNGIVVVYPG